MKEIKTTTGETILVDDEDLNYLSLFPWWRSGRKGKYYANTFIDKVHIKMEYLVMGPPPKGKLIDHANSNTLDNRKENLRFASSTENSFNRGKISRNTSGLIGVSWFYIQKLWAAQARIDGKNKVIGYFDNKFDAARAYDSFIVKNRGEFARTNAMEGLFKDEHIEPYQTARIPRRSRKKLQSKGQTLARRRNVKVPIPQG